MKNFTLKSVVTGLIFSLFALSSASAATITDLRFDTLVAEWQNPNPSGVTITSAGDTTNAWWGSSNTSNASGYRFNATDAPFDRAPNAAFELGEFTHFNRPIYGTPLSSITLRLTAQISAVMGNGTVTSLGSKTFDFLFSHDETANGSGGCCADYVSISNSASSSTFDVNGQMLTLNILGFADGLGGYASLFSSPEGGTNSINLMAEFGTVSAVPLPPAVLLFGAALGGLGLFSRRRQKKTS